MAVDRSVRVLIYLSKKRNLNAFGFQEQRGVYLNKSFYLEKFRVSYFENNRSCKLFFDWKDFLILTLFLDASLNSCVQSVMQKSVRLVLIWWLH